MIIKSIAPNVSLYKSDAMLVSAPDSQTLQSGAETNARSGVSLGVVCCAYVSKMAESHEEDMEERNPFLSLFTEESALLAAERKRAKHFRELSDCYKRIFLITGELSTCHIYC